MKIIVGLGNPGPEYARTRHNLGFMVVDRMAEALGGGSFKGGRFKADTLQVEKEGAKILLAKPTTFMNVSGDSVGRLLGFYKRGVDSLLVIHDDMDLPLGRIKFVTDGSSGGHNGVESIIEGLGTKSFHRLRLGVGHPAQAGTIDYVLSPFSKDEKVLVEEVLKRSVEALSFYFTNGMIKTMDKYNGKSSQGDSHERV